MPVRLFALMLFAVLVVFPNQGRAVDPAGDDHSSAWLSDLTILNEELPKLHKDLFLSLPRTEWDAEVMELGYLAPALNEYEFKVRLMQLVARIGDSHTRAGMGSAYYPIQFFMFDDGIYVLACPVENKEALRMRLAAIDGHPMDEVVSQVSTVFAHENESQLSNSLVMYLNMADVLFGLGITREHLSATFEFALDSGETYSAELAASTDFEGVEFEVYRNEGDPVPMYLSQQSNPYYIIHNPDLNLLYLQYNACMERDDLPMEEFIGMVEGFIDEKPFDRFVIDLRHNGGGDSQVADGLIDMLASNEKVNGRGLLYLIIGRSTYSSAVLNALKIIDLTDAVVVGEPSGGKPNHFGEVKSFELPALNMRVTYSTKYFKLVDGDPAAIEPDIEVPLTATDFFTGNDPFLNFVFMN